MSKFGQPGNTPDTGFGTDADYPECIHYTLEYQISAEHRFRHTKKMQSLDMSPSRSGEVQIWVKLGKEIIDGRDCGEIPITSTPDDDPCEYCENEWIENASDFSIRDSTGKVQRWDKLTEEYTKQACLPDSISIGPPKASILITQGLYGFSCIKDWYQCGRNKRLEDVITPGRNKKLDFDQSPIGGSENNDREYNIVCKLFKMFIAAKKALLQNPCGECELLCKIINNTIFGNIGSKSGGKSGDCDYWNPLTAPFGQMGEEACEVVRGLAFEKWLDEELDNDTEDPGYPFEIADCPGCPGCD